jgi:hypothetical protein
VIDGYRHRDTPPTPAGDMSKPWRLVVRIEATAEFADMAEAEAARDMALQAVADGTLPRDARVDLETWIPGAGAWAPWLWVTGTGRCGSDQ